MYPTYSSHPLRLSSQPVFNFTEKESISDVTWSNYFKTTLSWSITVYRMEHYTINFIIDAMPKVNFTRILHYLIRHINHKNTSRIYLYQFINSPDIIKDRINLQNHESSALNTTTMHPVYNYIITKTWFQWK